MRQTKTGRWVPEPDPKLEDPVPKPEDPVPLYEQYDINLADPLPWWYPIMHFEAAIGRSVMYGEQS